MANGFGIFPYISLLLILIHTQLKNDDAWPVPLQRCQLKAFLQKGWGSQVPSLGPAYLHPPSSHASAKVSLVATYGGEWLRCSAHSGVFKEEVPLTSFY